MKLITSVELKRIPNPISYQSKLVLLGSCFAENMGNQFAQLGFTSHTNPFGILFHPLALQRLVERAIRADYFTQSDLVQHNGLWHCFELHSVCSNVDSVEMLSEINAKLNALKAQLEQATHICITLGTAWVYRHLERDEVVANCHKISQNQFAKELLSVAQIENALQELMTAIHAVNPSVQVVFTISPVRHSKDGLVENQRSKAHLLVALHHLLEKCSAYYFPAYEILLDELRDYRFYADDLLHPSDLAVRYIWDKWLSATTTPETQALITEVEAVQKSRQHRPFNPDTAEHQAFLEKLDKKVEELQEKGVKT
ncbi:MAG: GSCFA domain-containing protein [Flavobacterium sp.]|nr:GSCFA domain-containing protein [Flavobacterium sp.]